MMKFAVDFGLNGDINKEMLDFCVTQYESSSFKN